MDKNNLLIPLSGGGGVGGDRWFGGKKHPNFLVTPYVFPLQLPSTPYAGHQVHPERLSSIHAVPKNERKEKAKT